MTIEERLNELLEQANEKIEKLEEQRYNDEYRFDIMARTWEFHQKYENNEFSRRMPLPRLEMRLHINDYNRNWEWQYGLVYMHGRDSYNHEKADVTFIPLGHTEVGGGDGTFNSVYVNGHFRLPYRDGMHIKVDSIAFNLPAFVTSEKHGIIEKLEVDPSEFSTALSQMSKPGTEFN